MSLVAPTPNTRHGVTMQIPRFAFEKFPGSKPELSTQMKSVGEAMAMGRTFQESMQKALRSLETGLDGWSLPRNWKRMTDQQLIYGLRVPNPDRMMVMKQVCGSVGVRAWVCVHGCAYMQCTCTSCLSSTQGQADIREEHDVIGVQTIMDVLSCCKFLFCKSSCQHFRDLLFKKVLVQDMMDFLKVCVWQCQLTQVAQVCSRVKHLPCKEPSIALPLAQLFTASCAGSGEPCEPQSSVASLQGRCLTRLQV